jgi:hypothetical protein
MDYYCAVCEKEAKVVDCLVLRSCEHADSVVFAPRSSELFGDGGATEKSLPERAIEAIYKIIKAFR